MPPDPKNKPFLLSLQVVGTTEVKQLLRELESLNSILDQAAIRSPGQTGVLPKASRLLEELATANSLNLLQPVDRQTLRAQLQNIIKSSPAIHISFATEPSATFVNKLLIWLRSNIHPTLLLKTGLEPSIAIGCIVRTNNKQFDFSLRQRFIGSRDVLLAALKGNQGTEL